MVDDMEVDYLFAVALFVAVFAFAVLFVSNNVLEQKEDVKLSILKEDSEFLMNKIFSESSSSSSSISLISPMYKLYVYAENKNNTVDELVQIDLNKFGKNDPNSAVIDDGTNRSYDYLVSGNVIVFSSKISAFSTKSFVVYFDDDSNFPSRSVNVIGNDTIREKIYGPEKIYVVQNKLIEQIKGRNNSNNSDINYHISVIVGNSTILDYGPFVEGKKNVVINRKPVVVQLANRKLTDGWVVLSMWS